MVEGLDSQTMPLFRLPTLTLPLITFLSPYPLFYLIDLVQARLAFDARSRTPPLAEGKAKRGDKKLSA